MQRFRPRPFYTREAALGRTLGPHRVWVDNLPYDTTLADLTAAFASTWSGRPRPPLRPPLRPPSLFSPLWSRRCLALQRRHGGDAISTAALRRDAVAPTHGGARRAWYRHLRARPPFVLSPAPVSVGCAGAEKATLQYKCNVARIASGTARGVRASLYLVARRRLQFFGI
eukprot:COSAG04_NODE_2801_length_3561_cov_1.619006_5_plen_169_part_01